LADIISDQDSGPIVVVVGYCRDVDVIMLIIDIVLKPVAVAKVQVAPDWLMLPRNKKMLQLSSSSFIVDVEIVIVNTTTLGISKPKELSTISHTGNP
jgi:hypothetical protein